MAAAARAPSGVRTSRRPMWYTRYVSTTTRATMMTRGTNQKVQMVKLERGAAPRRLREEAMVGSGKPRAQNIAARMTQPKKGPPGVWSSYTDPVWRQARARWSVRPSSGPAAGKSTMLTAWATTAANKTMRRGRDARAKSPWVLTTVEGRRTRVAPGVPMVSLRDVSTYREGDGHWP